MSRSNNTTTKAISSLFLAFILIAGTIITTTVSVYGQGPPRPNAPVTQEQLQQALANVVTQEQLQQVLNEIEECPAGTIYEGFFVNGDGDPDTTIPEDEVMTEICIPTAQLNVIKTKSCDVGEFGQEFCDSIREPKISVLGNNPIPSFFFGTEPSGTTVSLGPGAYHVDEAGFTEGLEPCKKMGFDGGRYLGDGIFICTNFSEECQGDITTGSLQTCTIDNNVLVEQNFLDLAVANRGSDNVSILLGNGNGTFGTAENFPIGGDEPISVAVGDFDRDGELDLAVANRGSDNVSILLGNGNGTFGTANNFPVGDFPISVAVGDFDRDGELDLAVANGGSANVSILLGNGDGTFGTADNFPVGDPNEIVQPSSIAAGDFNGDGELDIVTANSASDDVSILLGNGDGTFGTANNFPVGIEPQPASVAVGDFDGDGELDIVTANFSTDDISILLGNGDGTFGTAENFPVGIAPFYVASADFNGDGELDLAIATDDVSILLGNGDGTFGTANNFPVGDGPVIHVPFSIAVSDFDGDGELDLVTANAISNDVSILLGNGDGTFGTAENFPVGDSPFSVAVGDFN